MYITHDYGSPAAIAIELADALADYQAAVARFVDRAAEMAVLDTQWYSTVRRDLELRAWAEACLLDVVEDVIVSDNLKAAYALLAGAAQ